MPRIEIDKNKCKGCMLCVSACPQRLIVGSKKLNKTGIYYVEFKGRDKCTGCAMCAVMCPDCCIEVYR